MNARANPTPQRSRGPRMILVNRQSVTPSLGWEQFNRRDRGSPETHPVHDDDLVAEQLGLVQVVRGQQDGAVLF